MYSLNVDYHRGDLRREAIKLEHSYMGLISMQLASIGTRIVACLSHMAKATTVQASSF
jgi:hypothetical protein